MAMRFLQVLLVLCTWCSVAATAQKMDAALMQQPWRAQWITGPGAPINRWNAHLDEGLKEYGVYKFRKTFDLTSRPASFVVHVSADNRYKLFVNGTQVSQGPARGDLYFWNFETIDLAPYLQQGKNTVSALVWNEGKWKPEAQISYLTGFILQGNTPAAAVLNTDKTWKAIRDTSYQPLPVKVMGYYVAGPAELVHMAHHVKGWEKVEYNDGNWAYAREIAPGLTKDAAIDARGWMLVPSPLPPMETTPQRLASLRKADGVAVPASFPATKTAVTIPPNTQATLLLDQAFLTNAYPILKFSGGLGAGISMGYAEGLYVHKGERLDGSFLPMLPKENRDEVEGKVLMGKRDSLVSDGSRGQEYTPLWWRTYRYIQLKVSTKDEPLVLEDIYGTFTGYPFQYKAKLEGASGELQQMMDIGWRTARLCAFETYMDCPYYEQLQYIGDARIQALVSYYNSGDDRLARYAITLMDHSRLAEGITLSRYPTDLHQQIPTFSLWWIGMLHDYWKYRPDSNFIRDKLHGARQVLHFFNRYQQADGSLKNVPYWNFTDWVRGEQEWNYGMAPVGKSGESAVLDLHLMWTYQLAAAMEAKLGLMDQSRVYNARAAQLKKTIQAKYWDKERNLFADTEAKDLFSQHANALAILSGMVTGAQATSLAHKMLVDTSLAQASIYFKYYVHQAAVLAGLGADYLAWLDIWRQNMAQGLTTWAETSDVSTTRSDCHAWGSSPNIELFRTVLGIDSDAPGFSKIKIAPNLGSTTNISGEMPHPMGSIAVAYKVANARLQATITLPGPVAGRFVWKGKNYPLKAGKNVLQVPL
jgi:hypothetical protein